MKVERRQRGTPDREHGFRRLELKLSTAGIVIASISMFIAAISSYLSWQQIKIISNEHMTPYRSIYYSTKIDSYREIVGMITRYEIASEHFSLLKLGFLEKRAMFNRRSRNKSNAKNIESIALTSVKPTDELSIFSKQIDNLHGEYRATISRNVGVWSEGVSTELDNMVGWDRSLCLCSRYLTFKSYGYHDSFLEIGNVSIGEERNAVARDVESARSCENAGFGDDFRKAFEKLKIDMLMELRSEQLKTI